MRMKIAVCVVAVIAAGCTKTPDNNAVNAASPAVTTTPPKEAPAPTFEAAPLTVSADMVKAQDPAILAAANWTAKQCDLTLSEGTDPKADVLAVQGGPTAFSGFFIDPKDQPAGDFKIILKGDGTQYAIPARTGWDRSDVASFFKMPQLANSGFDVRADLANVPDGRYKVDFLLSRGDLGYFCESGKTVVVKK